MERPTDADNLFEDVYIYGKLNYGFENDEITVSKLNVTGISSFTSDVTFEGDITLDEITARNANVTGVATVGTGLYLNGKLFDGDGDFGTAGQLLSSDGTDLNWIDASTTSVANANNVGTNANSTNADQFITFVGASSGNNPIRVNSNIKYNPSSNTLSAINIEFAFPFTNAIIEFFFTNEPSLFFMINLVFLSTFLNACFENSKPAIIAF